MLRPPPSLLPLLLLACLSATPPRVEAAECLSGGYDVVFAVDGSASGKALEGSTRAFLKGFAQRLDIAPDASR